MPRAISCKRSPAIQGIILTIYNWTYDKLNRPLTMSDGTRSYTYDINGNITQVQVLNASQTPLVDPECGL